MNNVTPLPLGAIRQRKIGYRYPTEHWLLAATLFVIILALFTSAVLSLYGLVSFLIVGTIIHLFIIRANIANFKRSSVQVTASQFPEIHAVVEECKRYIDIPPSTTVFVSYSPFMNAFAMGIGRPYTIVLFSALVESMDRDELKYIIAHEMGHIHFKHTIWLTLIGQLGTQTYGLPIFRFFFQFCFLFWSRAAEMSADRAGLVANGRLDKAISAQSL